MKLASVLIILLSAFSLAQTRAEQVIGLAAEHPAFKSMLAAREGWQAAAYDTYLRYGNWRVQFWDAEGEKIGWAEVQPDTKQLYGWNYQTGLNDLERERSEETVREFVRGHEAIQALAGDMSEDNIRVDFRNDQGRWVAQLERGSESIRIFIQAGVLRARTTEGLQFDSLYFPNVPGFEEWQSGNQANIVALAFSERELAQALRGRDAWTSQVEPAGNARWAVTFIEGDTVIATATVNLDTGEVAYEVKAN